MLRVNGLTTSYGGITALQDVALAVDAGTVVALIGANGAGKTTLINSVTGVLRPAAGTVLFNGQPITGLPSYRIARRGLSQVPEGRRILAPFTVRENLELGWQALGGRGRSSQDDFARIYELFPRLKERRNQQAGSLSGGEQQMLAIGRALLTQPLMLLLDEPSLGLSPLVVGQVFDAIRKLSDAGLTLLIVEQNARRALDIADFAYVIERGQIVRSGPAEKLRDDTAIRDAYLGTDEHRSASGATMQ